MQFVVDYFQYQSQFYQLVVASNTNIIHTNHINNKVRKNTEDDTSTKKIMTSQN